jgi:hypothetical protein
MRAVVPESGEAMTTISLALALYLYECVANDYMFHGAVYAAMALMVRESVRGVPR